MKNKLVIFLTFFLAISLLTTACSQAESTSESIKISPSKLFQGDTIRLEPHLDMVTGCVDFTYKGSKENINLKYEIWEEGKLKIEKDILSNPIKENKFDGEISFSLKDIDSSKELGKPIKLTTVIRSDEGYTSSSIPVEKFKEEYGYSPQNLQEAINREEYEDIVLWGLLAGDNISSGGESIEKSVKEAKWGLLVKLNLEGPR